jgi:hypothetical protein
LVADRQWVAAEPDLPVMRVWVLMGNDYPDSVYDTEATADAAAEEKKRQCAAEQRVKQTRTRIYWRHYEFELK